MCEKELAGDIRSVRAGLSENERVRIKMCEMQKIEMKES